MHMKVAKHIRPLFTGAEAGHFTLPEWAEEARAALERLVAERGKHATVIDEGRAHADLVAEFEQAALTGRPMPRATPVLDARRSAEEEPVRQAILNETIERASRRLETLLGAEDVVIDHLRPALAEVVAGTREVAKVLEGFPSVVEQRLVLSATEEQREALARLSELSERYVAIREAREAMVNLGELEFDDGRYGEIKNFERIWPAYWHWKSVQVLTVPWPKEPIDRLRWLITNGAVLWMPLPAEQDQAAREGNERWKNQPRRRPALTSSYE